MVFSRACNAALLVNDGHQVAVLLTRVSADLTRRRENSFRSFSFILRFVTNAGIETTADDPVIAVVTNDMCCYDDDNGEQSRTVDCIKCDSY